MIDWAFLLAPLAVTKRLLRLDTQAPRSEPDPIAQHQRTAPETSAPASASPIDLRMRRIDSLLEHVELYVLAAKFADWMRESGEFGAFLPCQIDDALALFCDAKNYYCPSGDQLRAALGPTHGVTKRRVWRSDPLLEGLHHLTEAQRPYLYIISRDPPKSRIVYRPISDQMGPGDVADRRASDRSPDRVQTRPGPALAEKRSKAGNAGRSVGPSASRRAA